MASRLTILGSLLLSAAALILVDNYLYSSGYIVKLAATVITLAFIYFFFKLIIEDRVIGRQSNYKVRYYYSKTASMLYLTVILISVLIIWVDDIQALLLGFGLIAAAFTISIQDVARNFVGGIAIFFNRIYGVGDRIEVMDKRGDVIDIGLLYTTLLEIGDWVGGDQPTGRLSIIPNGYVLGNTVNNYTRDFGFIWDEMTIPVTYDSDWREAISLILAAVRGETIDIIEQSEKAMPFMEQRYFFSGRSTDPAVFVRLTDNWIELSARFVTSPMKRRIVRNGISQRILKGVEESEKVKIASQTFEIVGFPELRLRKDGGKFDPGDK
jgi:small-conductance mechanosensitive channel